MEVVLLTTDSTAHIPQYSDYCLGRGIRLKEYGRGVEYDHD